MTQERSYNCFVCSKEFDSEELQGISLSKVNSTRFKICQECLDRADPSDDYRQVREIVSSYLWFAAAKSSFKEASEILNDIKKK